jgi:hypothetical protein
VALVGTGIAGLAAVRRWPDKAKAARSDRLSPA